MEKKHRARRARHHIFSSLYSSVIRKIKYSCVRSAALIFLFARFFFSFESNFRGSASARSVLIERTWWYMLLAYLGAGAALLNATVRNAEFLGLMEDLFLFVTFHQIFCKIYFH